MIVIYTFIVIHIFYILYKECVLLLKNQYGHYLKSNSFIWGVDESEKTPLTVTCIGFPSAQMHQKRAPPPLSNAGYL